MSLIVTRLRYGRTNISISGLSSQSEESKYRLSVTNDYDHPSLCLQHVKQKRRNLSIDQWLTAFNVFAAVYTIKVPSAISSLMKYCEVVSETG